jgi:lipopolysaccharide biosynthesis glycosyltransferase
MGVLRVASGSSPEYLPHVAALLHSLLEQLDGLELEAHYLHGTDLPVEERRKLERMVTENGGRVVLHEISPDRIRGLPRMERIPQQMWYRTFLPELLPGVDKILYLDADIIAVDSVRPLWETELGDHYLAAVTNVWEPWNLAYVESLALEKPYFNSGVLLMNLELMRRDDATGKLLALAAEKGWLPWGDQDALNIVLGHRRLELHPRWNFMNSLVIFDWAPDVLGEQAVREAVAAPALRHFEGPDANKPWHVLCAYPDDQALYLRHRRATPWGDFELEGATRRTRLLRRLRGLRRRLQPRRSSSSR